MAPAYNPGSLTQTQEFPQGFSGTGTTKGNSGNTIDNGQTIDYRPNTSNQLSQQGDPDIVQSANGLKMIHNQLRSIFAKAREKANAFRYPKMKAAFDRELMTGIDSVGRAHAIILPTAMGDQDDD